jgi:hypothetical protein
MLPDRTRCLRVEETQGQRIVEDGRGIVEEQMAPSPPQGSLNGGLLRRAVDGQGDRLGHGHATVSRRVTSAGIWADG